MSTSTDLLNRQSSFLTQSEYSIAESLFEVIIPSDMDPGAKEAKAVDFLDNLLSHPSLYREIYLWRKKWRIGMKLIEKISCKLYNTSFVCLSLSARTDLITKMSKGQLEMWDLNTNFKLDQIDFFKLIRMHAIQGFLSDPKYFGNKDKLGWKCIGFVA